jgi:hypothetical protein
MKRIFEGSAFRFTEAGILLGIGLGAGWIVLASVGRAATVDSIAEELGIDCSTKRSVFASLASIHFLRVAATLASVLGIVGSVLIASSAWASSHTSVAHAGSILGLFWFLICILWVVMNWLLSTATIPAVLDRKGVMAAFASTISLLTANTGAMISAGALFGAVHLAVFVLASGAAGVAFGLTGTIPVATVIALMVFVAFAYCALADFLYICRVAAYVTILRADDLSTVAELSVPPYGAGGSVDKAELILSDAPEPAF